jgi:hypothetical protein
VIEMAKCKSCGQEIPDKGYEWQVWDEWDNFYGVYPTEDTANDAADAISEQQMSKAMNSGEVGEFRVVRVKKKSD